MRYKPEQLETALKKGLQPVYLITGDEPLQVGEAADAIRDAARRADYTAREVISIDHGNEWSRLAEEADALSIFADKKVIDLRLSSAKPGIDGSKALLDYCQRLPADTLLLLTVGKLDAASQKTKWFQAIDNVGVIVQIWPLQGADLLNWLQRRAERKGMRLEQAAIKILAGRIEGNLLAAAQEIEKLFILHGKADINKAMIEAAVADSSRFDVFKLTDTLLAGKHNRAVKILSGLKAEGIAAPVVLWALSREARILFNVKTELKQGRPLDAVFKANQIWDKRKLLMQDALRRLSMEQIESLLLVSAKADTQAKGQAVGDEWDTLFQLCLSFCRPVMDLQGVSGY
ncbi:DNA polymerase III subunit delta [Methylomonas methanica]|uniref:DNA polymerase III subunit delta n=1 Tax=Methylomonas methanica (strain DSM 25384 / MC09) TaxID=857087 RepID=G0A2T5_METMM|nr:DNA polymerase III subunit delta [Methylomonas methanica]AEG01438.1 DNA polymerase III, delta subunit [Methylomonas methanica MC09]